VSYRLDIRPLALLDITEAAQWYENRQPGLGQKFIQEVVAAIDALPAHPFIYRIRNKRLGARWAFPNHFPYRIVYCVREDFITIAAVIHAARHDRHWKDRFHSKQG